MSGLNNYAGTTTVQQTPTNKKAKTPRKPARKSQIQVLLDGHKIAARLSLGRLRESPLATWMTMIVIAIALALPTSFFAAAGYLQSIAGNWTNNVQISLYLEMNSSQQQHNDLLEKIRSHDKVASATLISADEGLKMFQSQSDYSDIVGQLSYNPLPAVIEVTPVSGFQQPQLLDSLVRTLSGFDGVDVAQLDKEWVERLHSLILLVDRISRLLGMALAIAVLLTIGNTLRLILKKYCKEIELMNMLGANKGYIRRPYLYMGFLYGIGGAVCAWILLTLALLFLKGPFTHLASVYHLPMRYSSVPLDILPSLVFVGGILGITGAWLTVNRDVQTQ